MAMRHTVLEEEILPVGIYIVSFVKTVCVLSCELTHLDILLALHHWELVEKGLEVHIAIVCHLCRGVKRSLVGGYHDDAVGTA